jgi:hypothetical protein
VCAALHFSDALCKNMTGLCVWLHLGLQYLLLLRNSIPYTKSTTFASYLCAHTKAAVSQTAAFVCPKHVCTACHVPRKIAIGSYVLLRKVACNSPWYTRDTTFASYLCAHTKAAALNGSFCVSSAQSCYSICSTYLAAHIIVSHLRNLRPKAVLQELTLPCPCAIISLTNAIKTKTMNRKSTHLNAAQRVGGCCEADAVADAEWAWESRSEHRDILVSASSSRRTRHR